LGDLYNFFVVSTNGAKAAGGASTMGPTGVIVNTHSIESSDRNYGRGSEKEDRVR
jgi:hypothetical protein